MEFFGDAGRLREGAGPKLERGHEVTISGGGAIHAAGLKPYLDCDGCLLLGDEPDLLEIADYMEASGKKIWRELSDIPAAQPTNAKREPRRREIEKKRINCIGVGQAPAGRWWVVLEYDNGSAVVESTHNAHSDAVKRAKELAVEHKVRWVQR
jgi:hypothetical protein